MSELDKMNQPDIIKFVKKATEIGQSLINILSQSMYVFYEEKYEKKKKGWGLRVHLSALSSIIIYELILMSKNPWKDWERVRANIDETLKKSIELDRPMHVLFFPADLISNESKPDPSLLYRLEDEKIVEYRVENGNINQHGDELLTKVN